MTLLDVIILGIVEGLTELLPVSSTGHLILLGDLLGHNDEAAKVFDVVIQLGAIVAVAVYFRARIAKTLSGLPKRDPDSIRLVLALLAAFVPTAIAGLLFHKAIKKLLFSPGPVAAALIVGGVVMMVVDRWQAKRPAKITELKEIDIKTGFIIGVCQCAALWPGASRSMSTIVGGQLNGMNTRVAAEFSFLLALPTLGAATVYDLLKSGHLIWAMPSGATLLLVGMLVSFVVTWLVVAVFLRYVGRVGMVPFGAYRIILGAIVLVVLL